MPSAAPSNGEDPLAEATTAEVDARFSAIVSGLTGQLDWDTRPPVEATAPARSAEAEAAERARRREQRKMERTEEVAAYHAERLRRAAEFDADNEHFVPPEPPPLPRPRRRTVAAVLMLALAVLLVVRPGIVPASQDLVIVLALLLLLGALTLFGAALRRRASDPADGDGWDDGARL